MAISQNFPSEGPNLYLNFAGSKTLDSRLSFSRASTGTYVDEDGLIKTDAINKPRFDHNPVTGESLGMLVEPARTNLLRQSIVSPDFGGTYTFWTPYNNTTITANSAAAPDGTNTAALVNFSTSGSNTNIIGRYEISLANVSGLYESIWVRSVSGTVRIGLLATPTGVEDVTYFTVGTQWTRIGGRKPVKANYFLTLYAETTASFSFYAWGGQCESGTFPTSYIPTPPIFTSRASSATFYNSSGILQTAAINVARNAAFLPDSSGVFRPVGLLVEEARTNYIVDSSVFTNSGFWQGNQGITISPNQITAPDNTLNGTLIQQDTSTSLHQLSKGSFGQALIYTASNYTISVFVKKFNTNRITLCESYHYALSGYTKAGMVWDFSTESIVTTFQWGDSSQSRIAGTSTTKYSNGWYRISLTVTPGSDGNNRNVLPALVIGDTGNTGGGGRSAFAGNGVDGVYIWGFQTEIGSFPTSYIPTTTAAATREPDLSTSSTVTRNADVVTLPGTSTIFNSSGSTLLSLKSQDSSTIDSSSLTLNQTSLINSRALSEILYYPSVLTSSTVTNMRGFNSYVTNGLVLNLDAGVSSSYPGTGTTWTDLSGRGNNGTLVNGPTYNSANGGSIVFDGTNDYVGLPANTLAFGTGQFSIEAWVYASSFVTNSHIFSSQSSNLSGFINIGYNVTPYTGFLVSDFNGSTRIITTNNNVVSLNTWYHVVGLRNSSNQYVMYVNGVASTTNNTSTTSLTAADPRIGVNPATNSEIWNGRISNLKLYNRALTATEVTQNFNALRGRYGI